MIYVYATVCKVQILQGEGGEVTRNSWMVNGMNNLDLKMKLAMCIQNQLLILNGGNRATDIQNPPSSIMISIFAQFSFKTVKSSWEASLTVLSNEPNKPLQSTLLFKRYNIGAEDTLNEMGRILLITCKEILE